MFHWFFCWTLIRLSRHWACLCQGYWLYRNLIDWLIIVTYYAGHLLPVTMVGSTMRRVQACIDSIDKTGISPIILAYKYINNTCKATPIPLPHKNNNNTNLLVLIWDQTSGEKTHLQFISRVHCMVSCRRHWRPATQRWQAVTWQRRGRLHQ